MHIFQNFFSGLSDADVTGVSYSGAVSGALTGDDLTYLVRDTAKGLRVDIPGLPAGTYDLTPTTAKGVITQSGIAVTPQDRSGYVHFGYTEGVGAYEDSDELFGKSEDTCTLRIEDAVLAGELTDSISY